ncbi:MAG: DNA polymerase III subunit epsilon [Proteobacteria bacterium]|nr:DNA polymerase III subunit epsilon [Pseudomonadota bacterium]
MREIVLDTETTGLDPRNHRILELACIELVNHIPTGAKLHTLIDPEMEISAEAAAIHGITNAKLKGAPVFSGIVSDFLEFIGDSKLVIHNAEFDVGFLNAELVRLGFPKIPIARALDTVQLARKKFPGAPASLDALCKRFGIDNAHRTLHGALLDADLLAQVYLELIGGRQAMLLASEPAGNAAAKAAAVAIAKGPVRPARPHAPSEAEAAAHAAAIAKIKNPVWLS